jgi:transcriptional regulator with XRE-family HTH domain
MGAVKDKLKKAVTDLRQEMNLNQTEFGDKLGVSPMAISRWESGKNDPPADCVVKMAILSGNANTFWQFLGFIGLTKKDFSKFK